MSGITGKIIVDRKKIVDVKQMTKTPKNRCTGNSFDEHCISTLSIFVFP